MTDYSYPDANDEMTNRLARAYGARWSGDESHVLAEAQRLLGDAVPFGSALDAGCGEGRLLPWLSMQATRVVGIEPDAGRLDRARAACPDVKLVSADATALPFEDGSFDLVLSSHVIQHVSHDRCRRMLRELSRVLKAGGCFVLLATHSKDAEDHFLVVTSSETTSVGAEGFDRAAETPREGALPVRKFAVPRLLRELQSLGLRALGLRFYHREPGVAEMPMAELRDLSEDEQARHTLDFALVLTRLTR